MYRKSFDPNQTKSSQESDGDNSPTKSSNAINKEEFRSESIAALRARAQAHAAMIFNVNGSEQLSPHRPATPVEIMDSSSSRGESDQEEDRNDALSE